MFEIPNSIEKIEREQVVTLLDVTPSATTMSLKVLGVGITDYGISYNPQVDNEKWIIEKNSRSDHKSNQKQSSVSQKCYKGDPCFEFVEKGRDKLNYKTHIVDVDIWKETTTGSYPAKLNDAKIVITKYMSESAVIEYDLYYEGDPIEGIVTVANGVATFTPNASTTAGE